MIHFVGAGPGAEDLITVRGQRYLEQADVVIYGGYKEDTPAAIVYKATWPEEESYICTVSTLAETAKAHGITKTALIIVGDVVTHHAYGRSKLYDPEFTTEFRQGVK